MSSYRIAALLLLLVLSKCGEELPPALADVRPFTRDEKTAIVGSLMNADRVRPLVSGQRVRALSVAPEEEKTVDERPGRRLAKVVFVNYGTGAVFTVVADAATLQVLDVQLMRGRPQSSEDERAEARVLIEQDPTLGPLLRQGAVLDGGFVVDPPSGAPPTGRYLEFHVLSADRTRFEREVVVDLASQKVITSREYRRSSRALRRFCKYAAYIICPNGHRRLGRRRVPLGPARR